MPRRCRAPQPDLIASYADRAGRRHRIVLRGRLVLDLCSRSRTAVVVAELGPEEGIDQARAAVMGGEFDPGYLARARAGERPLGRRVTADDLAARQTGEPDPSESALAPLGEDERLAA
jgi:hypothetical protein